MTSLCNYSHPSLQLPTNLTTDLLAVVAYPVFAATDLIVQAMGLLERTTAHWRFSV